jgi:hypothetical protein
LEFGFWRLEFGTDRGDGLWNNSVLGSMRLCTPARLVFLELALSRLGEPLTISEKLHDPKEIEQVKLPFRDRIGCANGLVRMA